MIRDKNVKHYVGLESEINILNNPGDFFRAKDSDKLFVIGANGKPEGLTTPYKTFSAVITQNGTGELEMLILSNDTGLEFPFPRNSAGSFIMQLSGDYTKRIQMFLGNSGSSSNMIVRTGMSYDDRDDNTQLRLVSSTFNSGTPVPADNVFENTPLTIKVFPEYVEPVVLAKSFQSSTLTAFYYQPTPVVDRTIYHAGEGAFPAVGDAVFTDVSMTTPMTVGSLYFLGSISLDGGITEPENHWMEVSLGGDVLAINNYAYFEGLDGGG